MQILKHKTNIDFVGKRRVAVFLSAVLNLAILVGNTDWALPDAEKTAALAAWSRLLRPDGCLAILDGDWCSATPLDRGDASSLTADEVRTLMERQGFHEVKVDDLEDLSRALMARASQERHPLTSFARYLVWGRTHGSRSGADVGSSPHPGSI